MCRVETIQTEYLFQTGEVRVALAYGLYHYR